VNIGGVDVGENFSRAIDHFPPRIDTLSTQQPNAQGRNGNDNERINQ
jgi:hypothetical protein